MVELAVADFSKIQQLIYPLCVGIVLVGMGFATFVFTIKNKGRKLQNYSLLKGVFGEKINHLIGLTAGSMLILLGLVVLIFGETIRTPIVVGIFFIILSIENATGIFSGFNIHHSEDRYSERILFIITITTSAMSLLFGASVVAWYLLVGADVTM